jgi:hypothetical protein
MKWKSEVQGQSRNHRQKTRTFNINIIQHAKLSSHGSQQRPGGEFSKGRVDITKADWIEQYAMLKVLAAEPSNTVIGLVRNKKATQDRLAADGVTSAHILASDITDEQGLKLAAEAAGKILGDSGLDVLINNAAYVSDVTALKSLRDL